MGIPCKGPLDQPPFPLFGLKGNPSLLEVCFFLFSQDTYANGSLSSVSYFSRLANEKFGRCSASLGMHEQLGTFSIQMFIG